MRFAKVSAIVAGVLVVAGGMSPAAAAPDPYTRQLLTPNDFNYDGHSVPATYDGHGTWSISGDFASPYHLGTTGDIPAVTNNGDGFAQYGVFRPSTGTWYLTSFGEIRTYRWGATGDIPVQAHYRGISNASVIAVFRPSTASWYISGVGTVRYGAAGDIPVPGHYFGTDANDYTDHIAVFRPSNGTWYRQGQPAYRFGAKGDVPAPGDYDGNGTTDIAVYRPSTQTWYVSGRAAVHYGTAGDIPVTGDYNGDGRIDITVFRPSTATWYTRGAAAVLFGAPGDFPIGKAPYRD